MWISLNEIILAFWIITIKNDPLEVFFILDLV